MDYPPRTCIVCLKTFTPHRNDQIFCSYQEDYTCSDALRRVERFQVAKFLKAMIVQDMACWDCGAVDVSVLGATGSPAVATGKSCGLVTPGTARLQALLRTPYKAAYGVTGPANDPITTTDMLASCVLCRRRYHLRLSTQPGESIEGGSES